VSEWHNLYNLGPETLKGPPTRHNIRASLQVIRAIPGICKVCNLLMELCELWVFFRESLRSFDFLVS
jgi:hypothetical protein